MSTLTKSQNLKKGKNMQTLKLKFIGDTDMITHNSQGADPLNPYTKALKIITGKRKKTDQDHMDLGRIEWESGLYLHDGVVVMPAINLDRCLWDGAKKVKNGVKYKSGVFPADDYSVLSYAGKQIKTNGHTEIPDPALDKFYKDNSIRMIVVVNRNRIVRVRPIFHDWSFKATLLYDELVIDRTELIACATDAGRLIGMCEMRPRHGRFHVEVLEG